MVCAVALALVIGGRRTIGGQPSDKHRTICSVLYFSVYECLMFVLSSKNTGIKILAIYFLILKIFKNGNNSKRSKRGL
ncbi:ribose/xylose/arabinose/galactoside ABC-type transport system permease subunit [Sphingobacterium sp. BIGb0116]|nr:ribose/xylose/arabinose/galactoside ABC-type transport system permease subunit [Sphingobacterium sp. BIGb0116]